MSHTNSTGGKGAAIRWTYSETIDEERAAIRVRGRVDRLAVDLLRGTIEELDRRGHRDITVEMAHSGSVDVDAQVVLADVAAHLADSNSHLTLVWSRDDEDRRADPSGTRDSAVPAQ